MDFIILEAVCSKCGETYNPDQPGEAHLDCGGQPTPGTEGGYIAPNLSSQEYPYGKGNQGPGTGPDGERLI